MTHATHVAYCACEIVFNKNNPYCGELFERP